MVECADSSFICLVINCNSTDKILKKFPRTHELPKLNGSFHEANRKESQARNQLLQEHNERLREIFEKLRQFNLNIEQDKCEF